MTTYKEINGTNIKNLSSDPANPIEGQLWYNTTSGTLKGRSVSTLASWASGGSMAVAKTNFAGAGTQTAALAFGGQSPGSATESYDGTSWTNLGNIFTQNVSNLAGCGTQTAALAFGGQLPPVGTDATSEFNGTSWAAGGNLIEGGTRMAAAGSQGAGLRVAGQPSSAPPYKSNLTEEYNGTLGQLEELFQKELEILELVELKEQQQLLGEMNLLLLKLMNIMERLGQLVELCFLK